MIVSVVERAHAVFIEVLGNLGTNIVAAFVDPAKLDLHHRTHPTATAARYAAMDVAEQVVEEVHLPHEDVEEVHEA